MKPYIPLLLLVLLLTGCSLDLQSASTAEPYVKGRWATVTKVSDGDTLELDDKEKVRLIGVNTPETVKPNTPVQPYGQEASDFTKKQLQGKRVYIEVDVQPTDKYGRTLAYLYTKAPTSEQEVGEYMFNATLLREGYAQLMTIPPNVKYQELFRTIQREARQSDRGLWALGLYKDEVKSTNDIFLKPTEPSNESAPSASSSASSPCAGPIIKGNQSSTGEKIYHVPGGRYYTQTKPEEEFCTEQAAQSAGYRKSKQ